VTARKVSPGELVGANGPTQLATIVQTNPVYVSPSVDSATGTLAVRAMLQNKTDVLAPAISSACAASDEQNSLLVPDAALGNDQGGRYLLIVWLDPDKIRARGLVPQDVIQALQQQSEQVTAGQIGAPLAPSGQSFQSTLNVAGKLSDPAEFAAVIVKTGQAGEITRVRDVATRRARSADLWSVLLARWQDGGRPGDLPGARRECARGGRRGKQEDGGAHAGVSPGFVMSAARLPASRRWSPSPASRRSKTARRCRAPAWPTSS
jgi:AcrB/AcrD/AcrF family